VVTVYVYLALGLTHFPIPVLLEASSPAIKRKGRETERLAASAEVKNECSCNFNPSYAFMACTG
jgi:hypothetical protein